MTEIQPNFAVIALFRQRFVSSFGLKSEYAANPKIFEKYSQCPAAGLHLDLFWTMLMAEFYKFKNHYENLDAETNIAKVENRVKLLKEYTGSKII